MSDTADRTRPLRNNSRAIDRRAGERLPLVVNTQGLRSNGSSLDVWLIDVSPSGCQLFARLGVLQSGHQIALLLGAGERQSGRVIWASGMKAGVKFDLALPSEIIERLLTVRSAPSSANVRDLEKLVDQFGRELPPLPALIKIPKTG